jgi:hypothetical protein
MLGNKQLGVFLYLSVVFATLLVGMLDAQIFKKRREKIPTTPFSSSPSFDLVAAIKKSGGCFLQVCAFVLFFSFVAECVRAAANELALPKMLTVLISGTLEMTTGMQQLSATSPSLAPLLAAFFAGSTGLCVSLQIFSICEGAGASYLHYGCFKLAAGSLSVGLLQLFMLCGFTAGAAFPPALDTMLTIKGDATYLLLLLLMLLFYTLFAVKKRK